jgi:cation transport protein ChaC
MHKPGVGLGLVPGGDCVGVVFGVSAADWPVVRLAVDERELVTGVYERVELTVQMIDSNDESITAIVYIARTDHPQFLYEPDEDELVRRIAFAHGSGGECLDYWRETISALRALNIEERDLSRLVTLADQLHASQNDGHRNYTFRDPSHG